MVSSGGGYHAIDILIGEAIARAVTSEPILDGPKLPPMASAVKAVPLPKRQRMLLEFSLDIAALDRRVAGEQ